MTRTQLKVYTAATKRHQVVMQREADKHYGDQADVIAGLNTAAVVIAEYCTSLSPRNCSEGKNGRLGTISPGRRGKDMHSSHIELRASSRPSFVDLFSPG